MSLDPNKVVTISLEVKEWDVVFQSLGEMPFRIVQPVIQKMGAQLQSASAPGPQEQEPSGPRLVQNTVQDTPGLY